MPSPAIFAVFVGFRSSSGLPWSSAPAASPASGGSPRSKRASTEASGLQASGAPQLEPRRHQEMPSVSAWAAISARKLRASASGSGSGAVGGSLWTDRRLRSHFPASQRQRAALRPSGHPCTVPRALVHKWNFHPVHSQKPCDIDLGGFGTGQVLSPGTPQCLKEYASTLRSSLPSTVLGRNGCEAREGPRTQLMNEYYVSIYIYYIMSQLKGFLATRK